VAIVYTITLAEATHTRVCTAGCYYEETRRLLKTTMSVPKNKGLGLQPTRSVFNSEAVNVWVCAGM
jgi:hypothetical protein